MSRVHLHIIGKVQKVGYRYSAQQTAQSLHLSGWVKNLPDGSVLTEASGNKADIQFFIDWCKRGPANAIVEAVEINRLNQDDKLQAENDVFPRFKIIS